MLKDLSPASRRAMKNRLKRKRQKEKQRLLKQQQRERKNSAKASGGSANSNSNSNSTSSSVVTSPQSTARSNASSTATSGSAVSKKKLVAVKAVKVRGKGRARRKGRRKGRNKRQQFIEERNRVREAREHELDNSDYESEASEDYSEDEDEGRSAYKKGGYHPVNIGDVYKGGRYVIEQKLGWGHFSTVWLATDQTKPDTDPRKLVAIKFQKSASQYTEAAEDEIELLGVTNKNDPDGKRFVVSFLDNFTVQGPHGKHVCMVFEVVGENLLALIKKFKYRGIPLHIVKVIAFQCLIGLDFLHHTCAIIHTDLKPENIFMKRPIPFDLRRVQRRRKRIVQERERKAAEARLEEAKAKLLDGKLNKNQRRRLKAKLEKEAAKAAKQASGDDGKNDDDDVEASSSSDADNAEVEKYLVCKIGDLGNACWVNRHFTDDVTTRQYRAPEVIVGCPYSTPIDVWSLACIVFELITGDYLFDPKEDPDERHSRDEDHLALMTELLGKFPKKLTSQGKYSKEFFDKKGNLRHIHDLDDWPLENVLYEKYKLPRDEADQLASFLKPMLNFNPAQRATAADALTHPWLAGLYDEWEQHRLKAFAYPVTPRYVYDSDDSDDAHDHIDAEDDGDDGYTDDDDEEEEEHVERDEELFDDDEDDDDDDDDESD
eukprot:TRINITY_DN66028_c6_g1_i1.p1 TRINITY_DN66028_c6_g1~~TRINITY_DN66028_c6_g1_i1.p1  ORF type:complete len:745 (+),score=378.50 TRINITY_DN66028_c6_g1_i1:260-2236(+)